MFLRALFWESSKEDSTGIKAVTEGVLISFDAQRAADTQEKEAVAPPLK